MSPDNIADAQTTPLTSDDILRYSRQLLIPQFGTEGQTRLKASRALIVGLGGLGSPAALYLAGAGIGTLGLVDRPNDSVDVTNLHRQPLYTLSDVATLPKASLAVNHLRTRNPSVHYVVHDVALTAHTAVSLVQNYDIVLDCTDNILTRYLLGDACAVTRTPLVSGAAIGLAGQLTLLSLNEKSPCYRCIFPQAPPPNCVGSCDAAGVLGPVPGVIGTLQALEAIKVLSAFQSAEPLDCKLLLFDATLTSFRSVKLRPRVSTCIVCGDKPSVSVSEYDYSAFLNGGSSTASKPAPPPDVDSSLRLSVTQLAALRKNRSDSPYTLIDVRPSPEFNICHLKEAESVPLATLDSDTSLRKLVDRLNSLPNHKTILICRRGNASRRALVKLLSAGISNSFDVEGGLEAWHRDVDASFPLY